MKYGLLFFILFFQFFSINGQSVDFKDFDFARADSIALSNSFSSINDPRKIARILTENMDSEPEKFRILFRWITHNISYDTKLYWQKTLKEKKLRYKKERQARWSEKFDKRIARHIFKKRSTICSGYAYLLELMCREVNIECATVSGYVRDKNAYGALNHAWNAVKINNRWYLTDATWASGYVDDDIKHFTRKFNSIYFLSDPSYFVADHYPVDKSWLLLSDKPTLSDFYNSASKHQGYYRNNLTHYDPLMLLVEAKINVPVTFKFTSNGVIKRISVVESAPRIKLYQDDSIDDFSKNEEGFYNFQYKFTVKGQFDFYIYVNHLLTLTYRVSVN